MQIWNRDIDKNCTRSLIADVAAGSGTPEERAFQTHLSSLNGVVFEAADANTNPHWILRLGIWHRSRIAFGQQFCPLCLQQDLIPYFRLQWRLGWATTCLTHGCRLHDCCSNCGQPVMPHRVEEPICDHCRSDLRASPFVPAYPLAAKLQYDLSNVANGGTFPPFGDQAIHSLAVFGTVRQIAKLISSGPRAAGLRDVIVESLLPNMPRILLPDIEDGEKADIELLRVERRHAIMALTARCLEGWPFMFVAYCAESRNWWSWAMKDSDRTGLPFVYHDAARRYLTFDQQ